MNALQNCTNDARKLTSLDNLLRPDTEAQLVVNDEMALEAYKIRHKGYLSYGYITPKEGEVFFDKYDNKENSRTLIIFRNEIPAATIRICLYDGDATWRDADCLPAMEIFRDEILELQEKVFLETGSRRIIEITRFARDPMFANDKSLVIAAFRIVAYLRLYFRAAVMINAVRPHHTPMYRRLGFQKIEEPRQYPNLTYQAALMAMFSKDYDMALKKIGFENGITIDDPVFSKLISGERVDVFEPILSTRKENVSSFSKTTLYDRLRSVDSYKRVA